MNTNTSLAVALGTVALALSAAAPTQAEAAIDGVRGSSFSLTAKPAYISAPDGASIYSWGYTDGTTMQLPGPTLIVQEGATVTITLDNELPGAAGNTSIVFQGQEVTASGGEQGGLTREAAPGGQVTYTFVANEPGTYQYHSGTDVGLQVEMGLFGALIVEPSTTPAGCTASAYGHAETCFDREYLFILSEIDLDIHQMVEAQVAGPGPIDVGEGPFASEYWLMNGRCAPDTMAESGDLTLPHQPYNTLPMMHPGDKVLARVVGAGKEMHPFHTHGNHVKVLARDGDLILSETNSSHLAGPDLFTIPSLPGGSVDAIFEWTGEGLGWDMYGHSPDDAMEAHEDPDDHGKPIPVDLPELSQMAFGGFYSGSP